MRTIWALVNPNVEKRNLDIRIFGTGENVPVPPDHLNLIDTLQSWHI